MYHQDVKSKEYKPIDAGEITKKLDLALARNIRRSNKLFDRGYIRPEDHKWNRNALRKYRELVKELSEHPTPELLEKAEKFIGELDTRYR